jgi:hypothetical protein
MKLNKEWAAGLKAVGRVGQERVLHDENRSETFIYRTFAE